VDFKLTLYTKSFFFSRMARQTIVKTIKSVSVGETCTAAFIDNSGSTSYGIRAREVAFTRSIFPKWKGRTCFWNTRAEIGDDLYSDGGTSPVCIFDNAQTRDLFFECQTLIFTTDGQIKQGDVVAFASRMKEMPPKQLIVACVFTNDAIYNIDLSVFAPLMNSPNVLILVHQASTAVLYSKGDISKRYPNPTNIDEFEHLQQFDAEEFKQTTFTTTPIHEEMIVISETDTQYVVFDAKSIDIVDAIATCLEDELNEIIKYCLPRNKLAQLRKTLDAARRADLQRLETLSKPKTEFTSKKAIIIADLLRAFELGLESEKTKLKMELEQIKPRVLEEQQNNNAIFAQSKPIISKWENVYRRLNDVETAKNVYAYSVFTSNRAKRAVDVTAKDVEGLVLDHSKAPLGMCVVSDTQSPMVLWVKKNDPGVVDLTNDYFINFPLAKTGVNIIVSNPISVEFVDEIMKTGKTVYREELFGYIPFDLSVADNRKHARFTLCGAISGGKNMHHVMMLFLSMLDDGELGWLPEGAKAVMMRQLVETIHTTSTFSDSGKKMKMIDAIHEFHNDLEGKLRQPLSASLRILKFALQFRENDDNLKAVEESVQQVVVYYIIQRYLSLMERHNNFQPDLQRLYCLLFTMLYGIPQSHSVCFRSLLDDIYGRIFFGKSNHKVLLKDLKAIGTLMDKHIDELVPSFLLARTLWTLATKVSRHEKPLTVFTKYFSTGDNTPLTYYHISKKIDDEMFGRFFKSNRYDEIAMPYAFYNGPFSCASKLFVNSKNLLNYVAGTFSLLEFELLMKNRFDDEIARLFGNAIPSSTSAHSTLQTTVAQVLYHQFPSCDELTDDMVIKCMDTIAQTKGLKGNIYHVNMLETCILFIRNFLHLRVQDAGKYVYSEDHRSFKHKLLTELQLNGINPVGDIITINNSIQPPVNLTENFPTDLFIKYRNLPGCNNDCPTLNLTSDA